MINNRALTVLLLLSLTTIGPAMSESGGKQFSLECGITMNTTEDCDTYTLELNSNTIFWSTHHPQILGELLYIKI